MSGTNDFLGLSSSSSLHEMSDGLSTMLTLSFCLPP
eukprot:CAMPEP_0205927480 /NCGR_PEP_ID=MMETSP1325-20131115/22710_1 /ASSEMBLY_ACC=CAM_ASM_000708 /TAXON_ID=236786 /ORGANISM="Florenciella sp., Strain RCC1007" /LENGTH=35 /DNA_ID= /DNA_START= /DNA_END= /DNA_ORIENTATION=